MLKIYVASSWRNDIQPEVVDALRAAGYDVYDFKNPCPGNTGFQWSEIDPDWKDWETEAFVQALSHPIAETGFCSDMFALASCDILVLVLPCNRSAHLEAGWAAGSGKKVYILIPDKCEPELMYKVADGVYGSIEQLVQALGEFYPDHKMMTSLEIVKEDLASFICGEDISPEDRWDDQWARDAVDAISAAIKRLRDCFED